MRTKALLLTAALGLAGAATSMAQAVYSVNVVGYINLPIANGFNLVANQLVAGNNSLNAVFPSVLPDSQVLKFVNNNYTIDLFDGTSWLDYNTGNPSLTTVSPGEGLFFYNPEAATTVTLVGEVRTGSNLQVPIGGNGAFSLVSHIVPQTIALDGTSGFVPTPDMQYLTFSAATQSYNVASLYDGSGWLNYETGDPVTVPTPVVGQGFFLYNGEAAFTWTRAFNPNN